MCVMMTTTVMVMTRGRLRQILEVGELTAGRGVGEVSRQLIELVGGYRVAVRLRGLSVALEVGRDLLCDLLVLGRIRLLQLLQLADQLSEW